MYIASLLVLKKKIELIVFTNIVLYSLSEVNLVNLVHLVYLLRLAYFFSYSNNKTS